MMEELVSRSIFENEANKEVKVIGENLLKEKEYLNLIIKEKEELINILKKDKEELNNSYIFFAEEKEKEILLYKDRLSINKDKEIEYFKKNFLLNFLSILDNLEIYNNNIRDNNIEKIVDRFYSFLEGNGVKKYVSEGKLFDDRFHNALSVVDDGSCPLDIVVKELRSGYFIGNDVLRHSDVVVNLYGK